MEDNQHEIEQGKRTIKDIVNTPFKKAMFIVQLISYILIPASPFLGTLIGKALGCNSAQIAGIILGVFILGEILFYGSLAFLGKEIIMILRDRIRRWFKRRKENS